MMYPDEEKKRKRKNLLPKYKRYKPDDLKEFTKAAKKLQRLAGKLSRPKSKFKAGGAGTSHAKTGRKTGWRKEYSFTYTRMQYCVPKFTHGKSKMSHYIYLMYYLSQELKNEVIEKPKVFGNIDFEEYKKKMDKNSLKWIISPESNLSVPELEMLAYRCAAWLEKECNLELDWQAAVHTDTAHPHIHMVFNGVDRHGKKYKFPKRIIKGGGFRNACQEILTDMIGPRSEEQVKAAQDKRPLADRLTEFDDEIEKIAGEPDEENMFLISPSDMRLTAVLKKRLDHLKEIGLASSKDGMYALEPSWKKDITMAGRYNTYLDAKKLIGKGKLFDIFDPSKKKRTSGTIIGFYRMDDENVWCNAVILKDKDGNGVFVPVWNASSFASFKKGDNVDVVSSQGWKGKTEVRIYPSRTPEEIKEILRKAGGTSGANSERKKNDIDMQL